MGPLAGLDAATYPVRRTMLSRCHMVLRCCALRDVGTFSSSLACRPLAPGALATDVPCQGARCHSGLAPPRPPGDATVAVGGAKGGKGGGQAMPGRSKGGRGVRTAEAIAVEARYGASNYAPLPVVLSHGIGAMVWDVEGTAYLDFLAAYSAVNQGHCHPRLVAAMASQAATLTLTSRAFYNDRLGPLLAQLCTTFGYERALPMNTGVEGGETAVKLARRWGYEVKGIPDNAARILFARGNFWGRTIAAVSTSGDVGSTRGFGPLVQGFDQIPYNDVDALEVALKADPNVAAFMVEPIQGEAGVIIPDDGYMAAVGRLCRKHRVLLIADEVQTGLGRTGHMLATEHDGPDARADIVVLGKALSGGMMPVSAVLTSDEVMGVLSPGDHGSTYGGNPLGAAVASVALDVLEKEELCANSVVRGQQLREGLTELMASGRRGSDLITAVRGRGLMNAFQVKDDGRDGGTAWRVCVNMAHAGVLAKPTHGDIIRLSPPLVVSEEQVETALESIKRALRATVQTTN